MSANIASHFFIHYLPKGVYVFEYSVQLKGKYQSGIASIQCLRACGAQVRAGVRQPQREIQSGSE